MSIFDSSEQEREVMRSRNCPRCGVQAGRWCVNVRQRMEKRERLHQARFVVKVST